MEGTTPKNALVKPRKLKIERKLFPISNISFYVQKILQKKWSQHGRAQFAKLIFYDNLQSRTLREISIDVNKVISVPRWKNIELINVEFSSLDFSQYTGIYKTLSPGFGKMLTNARQLIFDIDNNNGYQTLRLLESEIIPQLTKVKKFTLILRSCSNLADHDIQRVLVQISKHLMGLTHLNLSLYNGTITDHVLDVFGSKVCSHLTKLKHLTLSFSGCSKFSSEGVHSILSKINDRLIELTHLDLNFSNCNQIKNSALEGLVLRRKRYLQKLQYLSLNFSECTHITDEAFELLAPYLANFIYLKELKLNFTRCWQIFDKALEELATHLTMSSLKIIALGFFGCTISDESLIKFAKRIGDNLTQLQRLVLIVQGQNITEKSLNELGLQLAKRWSTLERLALTFYRCPKIDEGALKKFAYHIQTSQINLQLLSLIFLECTKVTDEGVKALVPIMIAKMVNIENLRLSFSDCTEITDEALKVIENNVFNNLRKLSQFVINVDGCKNITEKAVESLCDSVSIYHCNYQKLRLFNLSIKRHPEIKVRFIANLMKKLKWIPLLSIEH